MGTKKSPDGVRTPREIATRTLALYGVVGVGLGAKRKDVASWLRDNGLQRALTPLEKRLFAAKRLTQQQSINASWQSERLMVLLWALKKVGDLPPANVQCKTSVFQDLMPPYIDMSVSDFIDQANRRSDSVLTKKAGAIMKAHWKARDASLRGKRLPGVDIGIIQERHHAINWVIGYDKLPWDDVTTDT